MVISTYNNRWKDNLEDQLVNNLRSDFGQIWWTKENGAITIETNGKNIKIKPLISKN